MKGYELMVVGELLLLIWIIIIILVIAGIFDRCMAIGLLATFVIASMFVLRRAFGEGFFPFDYPKVGHKRFCMNMFSIICLFYLIVIPINLYYFVPHTVSAIHGYATEHWLNFINLAFCYIMLAIVGCVMKSNDKKTTDDHLKELNMPVHWIRKVFTFFGS